jgi:hypothetical protein
VATKSESTRVEFLAIPVVLVLLGVLVVLMLAADLGVWAWVVVVAALIVAGLAALALLARRRRHPPAFDAPAPARSAPASPSDAYKVLVVADESLRAGPFREEVGPHAGGRPVEAFVVAPELRSRLAHWTGDDSQRDAAETRLEETLSHFEAAGIPARGEIGTDDPIQAADDALRTFAADEVVFVTGSAEENWLEQDVLGLARERYDIPVTHISGGATAR